MLRLVIAVIVGVVVTVALVALAEVMIQTAAVEAIEAALDENRTISSGWLLLILVSNAAAAMIGGYIAAVIGTNYELRTGMIVALVLCIVAIGWISIFGNGREALIRPSWFHVAWIILPVPFVMLGAYVRQLMTEPVGAGAV